MVKVSLTRLGAFAYLVAVNSVLWAPLHCSGEELVGYNRQIRPLLSDRCFQCHGPDEAHREAGLRLDDGDVATAELESGAVAIVPGDFRASEMAARITSIDPDLQMPPPDSGKSLNREEIERLKQWIEQGAQYQPHWAYIPPTRPNLPEIKQTGWPGGAIDRFTLASMESEGLAPKPEADRRMLIRRVTLDLTGLPPTREEVQAFLADDSPEAYEKVVDRLLASSWYGEHAARYWLDAVRYGDTHGMHLDNYREMWPYRDWVIRAINENMPWDDFTIKQLAGDLLPDATRDDLIASGFNRAHMTTNEGGSILEEIHVRYVVDRVSTTGTVFLGLTMGCAVCHDHKFDPITSRDFYSTFAFFNNLDGELLDGNVADPAPVIRVPSLEQEADITRRATAISDLERSLAEPWDELDAEQAAWEAEGWKDRAAPGDKSLPPDVVQAIATSAARRTPEQVAALRSYYRTNVSDFPQLQELLSGLEKERAEKLAIENTIPTTLVMKERAEVKPAYLLKRGLYDAPDKQLGPLPRAVPAFLPPLPEGAPANRLGFAQWLVDPSNPLMARVTVNRFWLQVFGTGLVETAEDFGSQGAWPSHPELLDWLAVEFRESPWDAKHMFKLMVMSNTYRQTSRATADDYAHDPMNRFLARSTRHRLDAEVLRDQALAASGLLVRRVGGPPVKPPQPAGLWKSVGYVGSNTDRFTADTGHEKVHRRSLYTFWKRASPPPQMSTFDAPTRNECVVRRERTNTPMQALLLLNDPQYVEAARALAEQSMSSGGTVEEIAANLFESVTLRTPGDWELQLLVKTLQESRQRYQADVESAAKLASVGEMPLNNQLNQIDLAAWTLLANAVLNLDEVVTRE